MQLVSSLIHQPRRSLLVVFCTTIAEHCALVGEHCYCINRKCHRLRTAPATTDCQHPLVAIGCRCGSWCSLIPSVSGGVLSLSRDLIETGAARGYVRRTSRLLPCLKNTSDLVPKRPLPAQHPYRLFLQPSLAAGTYVLGVYPTKSPLAATSHSY